MKIHIKNIDTELNSSWILLMKNILFVCSENKLRSPTAENIFADREGFDVRSAGTSNHAKNRIDDEIVEWADIIFVMEPHHQDKIRKKFKHLLKNQRIINLGIPDDYAYMDEELIELLKERAGYIFKD